MENLNSDVCVEELEAQVSQSDLELNVLSEVVKEDLQSKFLNFCTKHNILNLIDKNIEANKTSLLAWTSENHDYHNKITVSIKNNPKKDENGAYLYIDRDHNVKEYEFSVSVNLGSYSYSIDLNNENSIKLAMVAGCIASNTNEFKNEMLSIPWSEYMQCKEMNKSLHGRLDACYEMQNRLKLDENEQNVKFALKKLQACNELIGMNIVVDTKYNGEPITRLITKVLRKKYLYRNEASCEDWGYIRNLAENLANHTWYLMKNGERYDLDLR